MDDQATTSNWSRWMIGIAIGIALVLLGAAGGIALARSSSPDNAPTAVDIGFNQDMSWHHLQAVQMANLVPSRSDDTDVRQIAFDIGSTQLEQIGRMKGWLNMWGELEQAPAGQLMTWMNADHHHSASGVDGRRMPGMATSQELARLRGLSGKEFDVLFLQLMTRHHEGGGAMSRYAAGKAAVPVVQNLANSMVISQDAEVLTLKAMLASRNAQPLGTG
ncbi:Uncharacterized conserved protein, DUF305 family [Lentzea albidocapillata subsp. violacea]|uniref:Uncharacterized conserved protein, DUF305 family n=1 Tax=Lentzea albidocapillata subsp. violacea TaxID=128104 RepID=A0A1H0AEB2_9PSEU|nr:DUF305 domain-containing protein [Lentzea albidocapillata]SDN31880.1 Uncharacterized conserved protein, DUF305 family [Lentzea albidocapillata subsp. violacea]